MTSLRQLYAGHQGKVSDKWCLYLDAYDEMLAPWRDKEVNLLEIGVQNGGSLDIWTRYFHAGRRFVGCDINPDCAALRYDDPRVSVIVGDANSDPIEARIASMAPSYDIIIDDGSHTSADIVRSFARYFPRLAQGGIFVVEDLHCSYWHEFEGGVHHPWSSINFFKLLVDAVNHEHWGVAGNRRDLIAGMCGHHGIELAESLLAEIHSISFVNSLCFITKKPAANNVLGPRVVAGNHEAVVPGHELLQGQTMPIRDERSNPFSTPIRPPAEALLDAQQQLKELEHRVAYLNQRVVDLESSATQAAQALQEIRQSHSWRLTAPLRALSEKVRWLT